MRAVLHGRRINWLTRDGTRLGVFRPKNSLAYSMERLSEIFSSMNVDEAKGKWQRFRFPSCSFTLLPHSLPSNKTKQGCLCIWCVCKSVGSEFVSINWSLFTFSLCRMRWWWWRCKWRTKERWWLRLIVCLVVRVSFIYGWRPESREMLRASPNTLYSCPFNSMCHCLTMPNETTVLEINCNEVSLYKFPGELF